MRLFFGIELDERSRRAVSDCVDAVRRSADGRFVLPANFHMTLCFAGETPRDRLGDMEKLAREASARASEARIALGKMGCFAKSSDAILFIGVEGAEKLAPLAEDLRRGLMSRGLPCDPKPFSPHITIARKVKVTNELLQSVKPERVSWTADGLTLFHSARINGVLTYTPIGRWQLGNKGA